MKKSILLFLLFNIFSIKIYSQGNDITIEGLKAPASPAFIILGINPTSIEKPATPKSLGITLLNTFNNINVVPKNFAFEVSPFWLYSHPNLSFDDYYTKNNPWMNTSFSIATVPLDTPLTGTALSFGVRTLLLNGSPTKSLKNKVNELKMNLRIDKTRRDIFDEIENYLEDTTENINKKSLLKKIIVIVKNYYDNPIALKDYPVDEQKIKRDSIFKVFDENFSEWAKEKIKQYNDTTTLSPADIEIIKNNIDTKSDDLSKQDTILVKEIRALNKKRTGFILDLSAAISGQFRNDSVKNGEFFKLGVWVTPAYSCESFDFVSTFRYIGIFKDKIIDEKLFDAGLRIIWTFQDFGLSAEGLIRSKSKSIPLYRYAINVEYKLLDDIYLTGTFGKDFVGNPVKTKGDLITLIGINFGLGKEQNINIKK